MRLRTATPLEEYRQEQRAGFGDREARRERREDRRERRRRERQDRRSRRQERRSERRLRRVQRKQERALGPATPRRARQASPPSLQPASRATSAPGLVEPLLDRALDWMDEAEDEPYDGEDLEEEPEDEGMEGFGSLLQRQPQAWGPAVQMGRRLRIQAAIGHRAAVIELKPGLYLVAEVPEAVTRSEFGVVPLLAPLMLTAAHRSMQPDQPRRGPFARLFRRREGPFRYVPVAQPNTAPPALPGPTDAGEMVVAAPNVGWADDATVAAAVGCEACQRGRRR